MRYTPHTDEEVRLMLDAVGAGSVDELFRSIPAEVQQAAAKIELPHPLSEMEAAAAARELASSNYDPSRAVSFLGGGAYDHYIPAAIDQLLLRSEFYTCYTPYQAEVSQGTLQAIYEYQSMIIQLTGMEIANASGYDGASVCADAVLMAGAIRKKRPRVLLSDALNPAYRKTVETYNLDGVSTVEVLPAPAGATDLAALEQALGEDVACVLVQSPNFFGVVENTGEIVRLAHEAGALVAVAGCPIALGVLKSPGDAGADIAIGEGQPLGVPLSYGGPYLGYFATSDKFKRQLPGRLVGLTEDDRGRSGYVLTLQTREQHIRREKATSNICTNQSLIALAATIHLSLLGKQGLCQVAELCLRKAHYLADKISALDGWELAWPDAPFFREFAVVPPVAPTVVIEKLLEQNILAGIDLGKLDPEHEGKLLIAVTEQRTKTQLDAFTEALAEV